MVTTSQIFRMEKKMWFKCKGTDFGWMFLLKRGEYQRKPSAQYHLSLRRDSWSVTVTVSLVPALCLMIDLHGRVTDKDHEAISNGRCNLRPKHCFIMMCAAVYTARQGPDWDFKDAQRQIIHQRGVFVVWPSQQRLSCYFQQDKMRFNKCFKNGGGGGCSYDFHPQGWVCTKLESKKKNFASNAEQFAWRWLKYCWS